MLILGFTFPNDQYNETVRTKAIYGINVSFFVSPEFIEPKLLVVLRYCRSRATIMMMPEATMYENSPFSSAICYIWTSWKVFVSCPESKSKLVQARANFDLCRSICLFYFRELVSGLFIEWKWSVIFHWNL
jgi:hypothetical protein